MNKIHQIQTWLIKHTQDIVNMYYVEGHQKKALAYLAGGNDISFTLTLQLVMRGSVSFKSHS